jgi:hypothetical protein
VHDRLWRPVGPPGVVSQGEGDAGARKRMLREILADTRRNGWAKYMQS